jgi:hypothetical protein
MIRVLVGPGVDPEVVKLFVQQLQARLDGQQPEIDETESVPVLEDFPEDPEVVIEQLNTRILELEAELEEHKLSVDRVLEALRPLGTTAEPSVGFDTPDFFPGAPVVDYGTAPGLADGHDRLLNAMRAGMVDEHALIYLAESDKQRGQAVVDSLRFAQAVA